MTDPVYKKKIAEHDENFAKTLEKKTITESREEIKRIWIEKVRMEGELQVKLATMAAPNPQIANQQAMIERTKLLDSVYLKYGLKLNYLQYALDHY
jgi:hypothetical protein